MILTGKKPSELDSSTLKSLRENIAAYKIFTALLTQVGTDDPIVTVLENTLGGTLSFTRISDGDIYYIITGTTGMFSGSTYGVSGFVHNTDNTNAYVEIRKIDDDICRLYVQDIDSSVGTDLHSSDYPIEIRVYSTIMPSPTPSVTPTISETPSISVTPSISETPSITPTVSPT